jgi:hypothetical protein
MNERGQAYLTRVISYGLLLAMVLTALYFTSRP